MIRDACVCGATIRVLGGDPDLDAAVVTLWQGQHSGAGHAPCTVDQANLVRHGRMSARRREALLEGAR